MKQKIPFGKVLFLVFVALLCCCAENREESRSSRQQPKEQNLSQTATALSGSLPGSIDLRPEHADTPLTSDRLADANASGDFGISNSPAVPNTFWGTVEMWGAKVPEGTPITAWAGHIQVGSTIVTWYEGIPMYALDVLGDNADTIKRDGAVIGDRITFRIGSLPAEQEILWRSGAFVRLDLTLRD